MPVLSGLELIKAMKASIELSELPVVAMTSYSGEFQRLTQNAGANESIDKSIEEDQLQAIIKSFIKPRASESLH